MTGSLPLDIISYILSRLPVKSLLRFKCVSKSWCSLISYPQFIRMNLNVAIADSYVKHQRQRLILISPSLHSLYPVGGHEAHYDAIAVFTEEVGF